MAIGGRVAVGGAAMSFQRKLLLLFALTIVLSVTTVAWLVSYFARRSFEQASDKRTAALIAQFTHEFGRRGSGVERRVETAASSDVASRMAASLASGSVDYAVYLNSAKTLAEAEQLDFLEFLDSDGTILSSAQRPAQFGYKTALPSNLSGDFLQRQELPDGVVLALCAARTISSGDKALIVIGGQRIDRNFVASLDLPAGMRALLYQNLGSSDANTLINPFGAAPPLGPISSLIDKLQHQPVETSALVHWSSNPEADEVVHAIPLVGTDHQLLGALLVTDSRQPYVDLRRHIRAAALLTGSAGILLAVLISGWAAARVTRPVSQLADAARRVAHGDWTSTVPVKSSDELGALAEAFNRMTQELLQQQERLLQAERVAAWRELARRLAHELKNPLFPLQLTVENLIRARQQKPEEFDEMFQEGSSTLLAEIANLKTIISRFSDFSRMPQPQLKTIQLNDVARQATRLFQDEKSQNAPSVDFKLELAEPLSPLVADPELLHRAIWNLVLNAKDAMPQGGTLTLRTREDATRSYIEVSDTGVGLTPEECDRIFTPYYTSKSHGTGLGLAIVQSIISDHRGRITVRSESGRGTTFVIELPRDIEEQANPPIA